MYAEFYNLAYPDDGITFQIKGVSLCGLTLRLKLPNNEWYFVHLDENNDFIVKEKLYTDFGVADKKEKFFPLVASDPKRLGLIT